MPTPAPMTKPIHRLALLLTLALCPALALAQSPDLPDTPAGRAAAAWFDAVRSGNPDRLRDLIENRFDPDFRDRVGIDQHLARHTALASAGINAPHSVARSGDHDITLYLRDGGVWGELRISVNPQPPHGITSVGVRPSNGPPEAQGRPATRRAFAEETTEFLDALRDAGQFNGAVHVGTHNGIDPWEGLAWFAPDTTREIPIDFVLDAIKLAVPLSVVHKSWDQRHPPTNPLDAPPSGSALERRAATANRQDQPNVSPDDDRHREYQDLVDSIFSGETPAQLEFQRGLINALVLEPLWMIQSQAPFAAKGRMNAADLVRFGRGLINPEYIRPPLLRDVTTGVGPDLDPSPTITRRKALAGFEERIDHTPEGDIRSFSAAGADEARRILLRVYPTPGYVVVILAPDQRTLDLIDRRIFNRLPGLEPTAPTDD